MRPWFCLSIAALLMVAVVGIALASSESQHVGAAATQPTINSDFTVNGSFEAGATPWQFIGSTNFVVYANGQLAANDTAYDGTHYAATNTVSAGGGVYQDTTGLSIYPGDTFCGSAYVRNQLQGTGASGAFVIWLLGGGSSENSTDVFNQLGNGANWDQVSTCVTATTAHTQVRVQFYPAPNSPTLDMDDVNVHDSLQVAAPVSQNGGFESGLAPWTPVGSTNYVVYANGQLAPSDAAYAGTNYGAMNTTSAGGSVYEDVSGLTISPGDTFCGSAEVRNQLQGAGASGSFVIWLLGGGSNEDGDENFSHLGNGANWNAVSSCVTATTAHTDVRIQFYLTPGAPTVDVDAVNVLDSLQIATPVSQNGSFEAGLAPWQEVGSTNYVVYANGQLAPTDLAYAGTHYGAMNTVSPGGGVYEDATLPIYPGNTFCGSAEVRDQLQETGSSGSFVIWLLGGASNESSSDVFSQLGTGSNWQKASTCVTATNAHSVIRIQFYPKPGTPTLDVDAVEVGNVTGGISNAGCTPSNSCTPQTFADTLLVQPGVNAPITPSNEYALEKWELAEGGGAGCPGQPASAAPWQNSRGPAGNPLNTTQTEPGSTNWNSVGVQIYANGNGRTCWYWGLLATTNTLTGQFGNYGPILTALRNPTSTDYTQCTKLASAVGGSDWGTGNFSADC